MTTRDLSDLQIWITRPEAQAHAWAAQLHKIGITTVVQPMLAIKPLSDQKAIQAIRGLLLNLDQYQKAIFVSQNAVEYGVEQIDRYWPQLPTQPTFFAIGETTAKRLKSKLVQFDASIEAPEQAMNSEALLNLNQLQQIDDEKIIIFRGKGGRTHLGKSLEARGALIDYCELYERTIPEHIDQNKVTQMMASKLTTVVAVHSGETLKNLCATINEPELNWVKQQPLLIPGQRVAAIANTLGFDKLIIAENATHESMIGALHDWRKQ